MAATPTTTAPLAALTDALELIDSSTLLVVNHSGGKDSQALMAAAVALVEAGIVEARQVVVVHAPLAGVEHPGTLEHIEATIGDYPLELAHARKADGSPRTLYGTVRERGAFPAPNGARWCTSFLKRDPINREIKRIAKAGGFDKVLSMEGIRAQESDARANKAALEVCGRNTTKQRPDGSFLRQQWIWRPLLDWQIEDVFAEIAAVGQEPHPAYAMGWSRLSCMFCIMAKRSDLELSARHYPEAFAEVVALELEVGHTIATRKAKGKLVKVGLEEHTGIRVAALSARAA